MKAALLPNQSDTPASAPSNRTGLLRSGVNEPVVVVLRLMTFVKRHKPSPRLLLRRINAHTALHLHYKGCANPW